MCKSLERMADYVKTELERNPKDCEGIPQLDDWLKSGDKYFRIIKSIHHSKADGIKEHLTNCQELGLAIGFMIGCRAQSEREDYPVWQFFYVHQRSGEYGRWDSIKMDPPKSKE